MKYIDVVREHIGDDGDAENLSSEEIVASNQQMIREIVSDDKLVAQLETDTTKKS